MNREILETVFGEALISSIAAYNRQRALNSLSCSNSDVRDEKEGQGEDDGDLIGTDQTAGKLQVAITSSCCFLSLSIHVHDGENLATNLRARVAMVVTIVSKV